MNKPKYVIVVGLDYSRASERALDEAFALGCSKHGVQMHVVNVRSAPEETTAPNEPVLPPWEYWAAELRDFVARKAAAFQATEGRAPFQHVYTHQRLNDPAHQITQLATDVEADLVVVGTHDWHGVSRPMPGSVAEAVTRLAPCPVLVVHRKVPPSSAPATRPT